MAGGLGLLFLLSASPLIPSWCLRIVLFWVFPRGGCRSPGAICTALGPVSFAVGHLSGAAVGTVSGGLLGVQTSVFAGCPLLLSVCSALNLLLQMLAV